MKKKTHTVREATDGFKFTPTLLFISQWLRKLLEINLINKEFKEPVNASDIFFVLFFGFTSALSFGSVIVLEWG